MTTIGKITALTKEQIADIADQLDCGNRCFINKKSGQILFTPDFDNNIYADQELFTDEIEELEKNYGDYIVIDRPNSKESFDRMVNFIEQLGDDKLKQQLTNALNKKKPFREFKFTIDNSGIHRQNWFDFKNTYLRQWVIDKFNETVINNGSS